MQKKQNALTTTNSAKGFQNALTHVVQGWFPPNPKILKQIQTRLTNGDYVGNRQGFVDDLKADLALFGYVLRELKSYSHRNKLEQDSVTLLLGGDLELIKPILEVSEERISGHEFDDAKKEQIQRLKYAVLSCGTSETIAEASGVDANVVYSCAFLRQLGLNLVAYNYPHFYSRALGSLVESQEDIEKLLQRSLGFYPVVLGYRAVFGGKISPQYLAVLGGEDQKPALPTDHTDYRVRPDKLRKLLDVGEGLARINDPEHFPKASAGYGQIVGDIQEFLGENGMKILGSRIVRRFPGYLAIAPDLQDRIAHPERNILTASAAHGRRLFEKNSYVQRCSPGIQPRFQQVYAQMSPGSASREAIALLIGSVVPACGFPRGCLYLIEQNAMVLQPRLRIGDQPLSRYKPLHCTLINPEGSPIVEALYCRVPIKQESVFLHNEQVSHITAAVGPQEPLGVLYLEATQQLLEAENNQALNRFRAIKQCLEHCLGIENT